MTEPETGIFRDSIEYTVLLDVGNFQEAVNACNNLSPSAGLASFFSKEEYEFIIEVIGNVDNPIDIAWVGLQREPSDFDNPIDIADAFEFLDGTPNRLADFPFVFPWSSNEPRNSGGNQFCAAISIDNQNGDFALLDDQSCERADNDQAVVCKRYLSQTATVIATDGNSQATLIPLSEEADDFDDGIDACGALDPPGQLASFTNQEEFDNLANLLQLVSPLQFAWVGLRRGPDSEGTDASDFLFLDGTSNDFVSVNFQSPWAGVEPNNNNDNQECTSIGYATGQINQLFDNQCSRPGINPIGAFCLQPLTIAPTNSPTGQPTTQPTLNPIANDITGQPSQNPTNDQINQPTQNPTDSIPEESDLEDDDLTSILRSVAFIAGVIVAIIWCFNILFSKQRELEDVSNILKNEHWVESWNS